MAEFQINGTDYRCKPFEGDIQWLVSRRLLPTTTAIIGAWDNIKEVLAYRGDVDGPAALSPEVSAALMPIARELAALSDPDVIYILTECMRVTDRRAVNGTSWVPVLQGAVVQDRNDAKFATKLMIAYNVLSENFSDMFASFGVDIAMLQGAMPSLG